MHQGVYYKRFCSVPLYVHQVPLLDQIFFTTVFPYVYRPRLLAVSPIRVEFAVSLMQGEKGCPTCAVQLPSGIKLRVDHVYCVWTTRVNIINMTEAAEECATAA